MPEPDPRLDDALDGGLDEAGWTALVADLRRDPAARAAWWRAAGERAALRQALGEDRGLRNQQRPLRLLRLAAAAALVAGLAAAGAWLAWPRPAPAPTVLAAGADRLELTPGADCAPVADPLARRWRLQFGRLEAAVQPDALGRPFVVETPLLLVEVTGTRFALEASAERARLVVSEGSVTARAGGEEVLVPAGAWAERDGAAWRLAPGLQPQAVLWDARDIIAGQAPLRRGERGTVDGRPACLPVPGAETPELRTLALDLPAGLAWDGSDGVLELHYRLAAAGDAKHPPTAMLQLRDPAVQGSRLQALACDRAGQHHLRLSVADMRPLGGGGRVHSLILIARPEDGFALLGARVLRPVSTAP